ncbi:MAG: serine/threonine protein kinase, partial [Candidatus Brocadiae bacterium]|nr:serine/threonine protein kinase [Candidatus Brocadiia bacterium]
HYAHQHGVIHRDIKPGNIMVDSLNRPRILDFGLSHASVEGDEAEPTLTVTGEFMGTPRYISPEQALGHRKEVDERTDVYALGVVLYELIVGVPPYPVEHARGLQLLEMLRQATALRPSSLHPTMPRDLEIILLKAVEKDKEQRYQSAEAFAQDLENYLEGRPISARPATLGYRFRKWAWRNRKVLTPVVLSLVVIATLTGLFAHKLLGLGQRKEELESEVSKFAEFLRRAEGAGAGVAELIEQGRWTEAKELAAFAPRFFPEEAGVEELPQKVREAGRDRVRNAFDAFADRVRTQEYSEARREAKALTALAEAMPYEDLQREAGDVEPGFEEFCWSDLLAAVDEAFARDETLARIEKFIELMGDNTHLAEAEDMLAELRAESDDHFLQQHVRAFDRAVQSYGWPQAERVLDSAGDLVAVGEVESAETWQEKLAELRRQLDSVIRAETAAKLDQLWPPRKHKGLVKCVEFAPDGGFLAVGGLDDMVTLYDTASGEITRTFDHGQGVRCVAISSNGALLAIGGSESDEKAPVTVWSVADGYLLHRLEGHKKRVLSVDFSPGGDLLASADTQGVMLWNVKRGKPVSMPGIQGGAPCAFSPDGRLLATGLSKKGVGLWDTSTGKSMGELESGQKPTRLAFSPDGTVLAAAYAVTDRDRVWLWNMTGGAAIASPTLGVRRAVMAMTFSPDGRILVTGGLLDRLIKLWDVRT